MKWLKNLDKAAEVVIGAMMGLIMKIVASALLIVFGFMVLVLAFIYMLTAIIM